MSAELSAAVGFVAAAAAAFALTPIAISIARRTDFYDVPRGYRTHRAPTPLLGGSAVLAAVLVAAAVVGGFGGRMLAVFGCAAAMAIIGTVDDRIAVPPKWRLLLAAGAASLLYALGIHWNTVAPGPIDFVLTVIWVVGLVIAFNLMDNLDGACGTVGAVAAAGIGVLAAIRGQSMVSAVAFALTGACVGFLRWNLARPARIFLGDGGSMPIGFLVAVLAMWVAHQSSGSRAGLLVGALLAGLPILDVTLVSISRTRRGVSLLTGGRDHLTHRILPAVRSPRDVAGVLAVAQACLCSLAIGGYELGIGALIGASFAAFLTGVVAILVLDSPRWRPAEIAAESQLRHAERSERAAVGFDSA